MDLAAASAGPWLVLGVVLGLLLAGLLALGAASVRRSAGSSRTPAAELDSEAGLRGGWLEDDLPGFLDRPPGLDPEPTTRTAAPADPPLAAPVRRSVPAHSAVATAPRPGRVLTLLGSVALLLVGIAAVLAVVGAHDASTAADAEPVAEQPATPAWQVPDLTALPEQPLPGDPGAGRLAAASVPIGDDGALARLTFEGIVVERKAVGVTVGYPGISLTAAHVPGGPALAHVRLPLWNCLSDAAPEDPIAAGCRLLPVEYADLPTPALTVTEDGDGLRISGRFATYVRPNGSAPEWTGRVYRLAVHLQPDGDGAAGTLHLGDERAAAVDDPSLSDFRRGR